MSRTGKKPIVLPDKVKARVDGQSIFVEGPLGKHSMPVSPLTKIVLEGQKLLVTRINDSQEARRTHGLMRALLANIVHGVSGGFTKALQIEGVGYRAEAKGKSLSLTLGFSHPVDFALPDGVKATVDKQTKIILTGSDKALVGQVAAKIRSFRSPEPYKGKGIRYEGEVIKRKVGKAAATASGGK